MSSVVRRPHSTLRAVQRAGLVLSGALSVTAAGVLQFSDGGIPDLRTASTFELLALLGLAFLPAATYAALRLERSAGRLGRQRGFVRSMSRSAPTHAASPAPAAAQRPTASAA